MLAEVQEWIEELDGELQYPAARALYQLPYILSRDQISRVLHCPPHQLCWRLLYHTGMRPQELLQAQFQENGLQLPQRRLCLYRGTLEQFSQWQPPANLEQLMQWWQQAATQCGLTQLYQGLQRPCLPHCLRHAFASHRLEDGMDMLSLYYQMGHRYIGTTRRYTLTALRLSADQYRGTHPLMAGPTKAPQARLSIEAVLALLEAHPKALARLILRTFYATGLRIAEWGALRQADFCPSQGRLFVRAGKGPQDRYVLLDTETSQRLQAWRNPQPEPQSPLFPKVSERTLRNWVTRAAQASGILEALQADGYTLSPHGLRHAFASHCYQQGMSLWCLAQLLGHTWLQDTLTYADCPADLREAQYQQSHPLVR